MKEMGMRVSGLNLDIWWEKENTEGPQYGSIIKGKVEEGNESWCTKCVLSGSYLQVTNIFSGVQEHQSIEKKRTVSIQQRERGVEVRRSLKKTGRQPIEEKWSLVLARE